MDPDPPSPADSGTTVAQLLQAVDRFISDRNWQVYHTPKNLASSIAIEAAELMEHFQWMTPEQCLIYLENPANKAAVADELADVLIYCLSLANRAGIDMTSSLLAKLSRNETRFPIGHQPKLE